jgi:hypothetical protein
MSRQHAFRTVRRGRLRWLASAALLWTLAILTALHDPRSPFVSGASAQDQPLSVELFERNGSGIRGVAEITPGKSESTVEIDVTGEDGESYLPFIHRGTCFKFNESISVPLAIASLGAPSETTVDLDFETLTAGDIVIDLHRAEGSLETLMSPSTSVACGAISLPETEDGGALQTPVAGIGPVDVDARWSGPTVGVLIAGGMLAAMAGLRTARVPHYPEPVVIDVVARHRLRGLSL